MEMEFNQIKYCLVSINSTNKRTCCYFKRGLKLANYIYTMEKTDGKKLHKGKKYKSIRIIVFFGVGWIYNSIIFLNNAHTNITIATIRNIPFM